MLARTLYRHLRRAAADLDARLDGPSRARELQRFAAHNPCSAPVLQPESVGRARLGLNAHLSLVHFLRACFDHSSDEQQETLQDYGFASLRLAQERIERVSDGRWHPKPASVALDIGQIYRHKKHRFRGVVVEWYASCPADDAWLEAYGPFERGREQPFYRTLVCTHDRPNPFVALAAEENLIPLHGEHLPVAHPLLGEVFRDFDSGRHIMNDVWISKFPDG